MNNVDVEIYVNNLINFFENNPNDLIVLIGELQKEDFYNKLRQKANENYQLNGDCVLTKTQIIDVVVDLKIPETKKETTENLLKIIQKTKVGEIFLN
jgi:hypothetical protein